MTKQTIARAARAAGVNVETIRYYERIGIIERPATVGTAYRVYPDETVRSIRFIKRAQGLGLSLREISDLLALRATGAPRAAVRRRIEAKVARMEKMIRDLTAMRSALLDTLSTCSGKGSGCPILRSLDDETPKTKTPTPRRQP